LGKKKKKTQKKNLEKVAIKFTILKYIFFFLFEICIKIFFFFFSISQLLAYRI